MPDAPVRAPFFPDADWRPVSAGLRTVRAGLLWLAFAPSACALAATGLFTGLWGLTAGAIVLLGLAVSLTMLIGRQVRNLGYAEADEEFLVRRGALVRKLAVVPYGRLQYVDVTAGPLARAAGYVTVEMHTAALGLSVSVPGIPADAASDLRERLVARGEARRSGL